VSVVIGTFRVDNLLVEWLKQAFCASFRRAATLQVL